MDRLGYAEPASYLPAARRAIDSDRLLASLERNVIEGALALLGWILVSGELRARIVETEAYAPEEPGCHSYRGETPRNRAMFGPPGRAYLYFTYGNHWMLNVAAGPVGYGAAVLVRAAVPLAGDDIFARRRPKARRAEDWLSGPGKLAAAFGLDSSQYGVDLLAPESDLRLEPGTPVGAFAHGTRVGLAPGKGDDLPWRFVDANALRWVSRPHRFAPLEESG